MQIFTKALLAMFLCAAMVLPQVAHATSVLGLYDSNNLLGVTVADQSALDMNPLEGVITYSGGIGRFFINVTTGITLPAIGTATLPEVHLNSVNVTSEGLATLTIRFLVTNLGPFMGSGFETWVGGTTAGNVDFHVALGGADGSSLADISTLGLFGPGPFADTDLALVSPPGSFSLLAQADIGHSGPLPKTTSFDVHVHTAVPVPQPGTLALLGTGLLGLGGIGLYRRRRN